MFDIAEYVEGHIQAKNNSVLPQTGANLPCYISDINVFFSIMCKRLVVGLGHGKLRINKKY
jgi:hypothetical protein